MTIPDVIARQTITPVREGINPLAKSRDIAYDVRPLFKYFYVPAFTVQAKDYARELMFQYNLTFSEDFYFVNVKQYQSGLTPFMIVGGCLCVKYRVGTTVYRYRLLDHNTNVDWSFFPLYTNQKVRKNFCIEFWADNFVNVNEVRYGLLQGITFQTSSIYLPTNIPEDPSITEYSLNSLFQRPALVALNSQDAAKVTFTNFSGASSCGITYLGLGPLYFPPVTSTISAADLVGKIVAAINAGVLGFSAVADGDSFYLFPPTSIAHLYADTSLLVIANGISDTIVALPNNVDIYPQTQENLAWLDNAPL